MTRRVRNVDEFRLELRRIRNAYEMFFTPQVAALRAKYAHTLGTGSDIDQLLH